MARSGWDRFWVWQVALAALSQICRAANGHLEVAQALVATDGVQNFGWQRFSFREAFPEAPVVVVTPDTGTLGVASAASDDPYSLRLRNVDTTGFEISMAEPSGWDGAIGTTTFNYIAASVGVWLLNDTIFEVGRVDTSERQAAKCRPLSWPNSGWTSVTFTHTFSQTPAVLVQIQTSNNEERTLPSQAPSVPWLTAASKDLGAQGMKVSLDSNTAVVGPTDLVPESVGYMIFEDQVSSGFEVPSKLLEAELMLSTIHCTYPYYTWLNIFSENGNQGCLRELLARSDCSQKYWNWGRSDNNCGCVPVEVNCADSLHQSLNTIQADLYQAKNTQDYGCLSSDPAGCWTISDKQSCLTSMDGQDFTVAAPEMTLTSEGGRRCVWCDSGCHSSWQHKCQPLDYLLHYGYFKETFEVAQCTDAPSSIPFLTISDILLYEDYESMNWGSSTWPQTSIAAGAWLSAAPLIIASPNSRQGSDGFWLRMNYGKVSASSVSFLIEEAGYSAAAVTYQQRLADGPFSVSIGASGGAESFTFPSVDVSAYIHNGVEFKDHTTLEMEIFCDQLSCLDTIRVGGDGDVGTWTVSGVSSDTSVSVNTWLTVSKSLTGSDTVFDGTIPWTSLSTLEIISDQGLGVTIQNIDITTTRKNCNGLRSHGSEARASLVAFDRAFHVEVASGTTTTTSSTSTSSSSTSSSSSSSSSSSTSSTSSTTTSSSTTSSSTTSSSTTSSTSMSNSTTSSSTTSSSSTSITTTSSSTTSSSSISSSTTSSSSSTSGSSTSTSTVSISSTSTGTSSSTTTTISSTSTHSTSSTTTQTTTSSTSGSGTSSSSTSTSASTSTTMSVTASSRTSTSSSGTFTPTSTSSWATTTSSSTKVSRTSTSITETTSVAQNLQDALLLELEQATGALLSELSSQNSTAVVSSPVGTMAALKLPDLSGVNDSFIPAILEDSPAAAILPAEALELAPGAALVMTTFNGGAGSTNPLGSGISASGSDGKTLASVVDAVDISLVDIGDGASRKVTVTTPIYIRLSEVAPATTTPLLCAFLDGDVWSQQGIRVATEEELNDFFGGQVNTTGLWCATTHLSIFSAFVDLLLDCTNVNVLSRDGLEEIFRNRWWFRLPALLLWLLLAALLVLLLVGVRQDRKLYSSGMWSDEYFLTELPPVARGCSLSAAFSRWREKQHMMPTFSTEKSMESIAHLNETFNDWMKTNNLQPRLSDKLQETILCQNTLREVALQHQVHPSFMVGHIWGPEGWVQGSLAMTKSKKLKSFQLELEEGLPQAFLKAHSSRVHRVCSACVAAHPVCELWQWDLHITSAKRAKIIADCILGSLAFVALFFSVDGTAVAARSPENCPVQQGTFLWYTFVAIFSILLNLIPRGVIMYIAYRGFVQESIMHRKWQLGLLRFKDACFWILGVVVSSIQLLVIIAFLANLSEVDEWKWLISFAVVLVRKMLVVPLLACLFASLGTEIAAWSQPSIVSQPPKKLGLDMDLLEGKAVLEDEGELTETWTQKVEELAQRGITIRQLLDFYASLGGVLMPHFDPDRSTTHDVVRQAIIPNSLHYRNWRTFMVVVHQASDLAAMDFFNSDPYCIVRCMSSMPKPWKGGGRTATIKKTRRPQWEEAFLLYEVVQDESLHLSVWDHDVLSKDDALGELTLAASDFWDGFNGTLPLQGPGTSAGSSPTLQITVTSYLQRSAAVEALEAFQVARRTRSKRSLRGSCESEPGPAARESTEDDYFDIGDHVPIVINKDQLHDRSRYAIAASKGVFSRSVEAVEGESSQWCCHNTASLDEDLRKVGICIVDEAAEERTLSLEAIADQPEPVPGYAYASCVNMGQPQLGQKMVTHSWRNTFSFLLAAIIADALGSQLYDSVMQLLKDHQFGELCEALNRQMKLDVAYWVCAFSVNQHAGICATPDATDSTGHSIQPCSCCTAKHFQGDLSEMNKFDHMMALLKFRLRQDFTEVRLEQVVAMEPDFSLLTRIWCIAELVEARRLHLPQAIMIHSAASRSDCLKRLFELDVRDANASFPADKELILNKIPEVDAFNRQLKDLILHRLDHFLETNGSRLAATIVDELVLAVFTIAF